MPKKRRAIFACSCCGGCAILPIVLFFGGTSLIGFIYRDNIKGLTDEMRQSEHNLKVIKPHLTSIDGARFIVGDVKNTSAKKTFCVTFISFKLFDKSSVEFDKAQTESELQLKPGGVWHFKARVDDARAAAFKLDKTIGVGDLTTDPNVPPFLRAKFKEAITHGKFEVSLADHLPGACYFNRGEYHTPA